MDEGVFIEGEMEFMCESWSGLDEVLVNRGGDYDVVGGGHEDVEHGGEHKAEVSSVVSVLFAEGRRVGHGYEGVDAPASLELGRSNLCG
jgi:hypothetical protein